VGFHEPIASGPEVRANDYSYRIFAPSPCFATFHHYFFDGWIAEVDRQPVPLGKDPSGLCRLELPAGVHEVRLRFVRTPLHQAALLVSGGGWAAVLIAALLGAWKRWRGVRERPSHRVVAGVQG
jgi:hypothetical protein